jgi:hypothetical protein
MRRGTTPLQSHHAACQSNPFAAKRIMHKKNALTICLFVAMFAALAEAQIDLAKSVVIMPFETTVKGAPGFVDSTQTAIVQFLKDAAIFSAVLTPEEAAGKDKGSVVELRGTLSDFAPGNMATRALVGLGSGRAHAGFDFTIKDAAGRTIWQKKIKETASFWSNSASSVAQRQELPEKVAKTLVKELEKVRAK